MHEHDQGREQGCAACDVDVAVSNLRAEPAVDESRKATVFMVVQTADDQDEAWWVLDNEDTRHDAVQAANEMIDILRQHGFFPDRLEDSKGSRSPDEDVDA